MSTLCRIRHVMKSTPPAARSTRTKLRRWAVLIATALAAALLAWRFGGAVPAVGAELVSKLTPVDTRLINYRVSPTHPRILLADDPGLARLKTQLQGNEAAARRFRDVVTSQMTGGDNYGFEPWYAALMFRLTGEPLYAAYAIQITDASVAAEEMLIAQDMRANVAGDSYLEVGRIVGNLALVYDWCYDRLTPAQRSRWLTYANRSVKNIWNPRSASWGAKTYPWTGWSVDNPSNNYYYSFLRATMLLGLASHGENDQSQTWLDTFRIAKLEKQLFPTFKRDLEGGGSREGTGYGTAMRGLFQMLDWWERSTGERLAERAPHTLASMAHMMHSTVPTLDRLAPTGDHARDSSAALFDYHRDYLLELIALFPKERLSGMAKTFLAGSAVPVMKQGFNAYIDFLYGDSHVQAQPLTDLSTTYWGAGTGQLMMRSAWRPTPSTSATYANFICGPYTESHAHRDQGSFVLYRGGWLLNDANMQSSSGIEQGEEMHNLLRFEMAGVPVKQSNGAGCKLTALVDNALFTFASARITGAYDGRVVVQKLEREFLFIKPDTFVVLDRSAAAPGAKRIWTLNLPPLAAPATPPTVVGDHLRFGDAAKRLDIDRLAPQGIVSEVIPWRSLGGAIQGGWRIDATDKNASGGPFLHVIGTAGSVASAARVDAPGQIGARVRLADGREAVVRFGLDVPSTSLTLIGNGLEGDKSIMFDANLPNTVQVLGLYAR
jgi:hypothetical protein